MSGKYTPGPWHVVIDDTGAEKWTGWPLSIGCADPDKSVVRPGGVYPYAWDASMSQTEAVANARLIAAAPELKQFAERILIYTVEEDEGRVWLKFDGTVIIGTRTDCGGGKALLRMESERRAAIAKATGESP